MELGDLDSILDDALDEFDREETAGNNEEKQLASSSASDETLTGLLSEAMGGVKIEEEEEAETEEPSAVVMHTASTEPAQENENKPAENKPAENKEAKQPTVFNSSMEQALKELTGSPSPDMDELLKNLPNEAGLDEMLKSVLASFGEEGNPELDKMMESIVGEMFSKENLEGPLKEIIAKYPPWIEKNKDKLTSNELTNYQNQFSCFTRMLAALEAGAPPTQMTDLLNEMQNYGQPPEEITGPAGNPFGGLPGAEGGLPPGLPPLSAEEQEAMKKMANECPTM